MRLLLDTHTLLWWWADDRQLSPEARRLVINKDNEIFVSSASAWEVATKVRLGKLSVSVDLEQDFRDLLARDRFLALPMGVEHGLRAGLLPGPHKDPFDRMLIAQAHTEGLSVVSNDRVFEEYGIRCLW